MFYIGGGWDGANSNKMLCKLDKLEQAIPPSLLPFIQSLKNFKNVVNACFGYELKDGYEKDILRFKESYLDCQDLANSVFSSELRLNWKLHIIFNHIVPFCHYHKCDLGKFAEQAGIELIN